MEKPVITKEQAEAIEFAKKNHFRNELIDAYMKVRTTRFTDNLSVLYELSYDKFFMALYIGYEVELEYKVGDWVVNSRGKIGYIREITDDGHYTGEWYGIGTASVLMYCRPFVFDRHATPEEIAEVKEREWWKGHGREVWELKSGDILRNKHGKMVEYVAKAHGDNVWFEYVKTPYSIDETKKKYCVVCFAENRMDQEVGVEK